MSLVRKYYKCPDDHWSWNLYQETGDYCKSLIELINLLYNPISKMVTEDDIKKGTVLSGEYSTKVTKIDNAVVKYGSSVRLKEVETIKFISENTSIPVPKVFDSYEKDGKKYIVMEYIEGKTLDKIWDKLSDDEKLSVSLELKGYINQLRNIEGSYIGSVNNGCCVDARRSKKEGGPFKTEDDFNKFFLSRISPNISNSFVIFIKRNLKDNHKIVFSHGDISTTNIIIGEKDDRKYVAAIIDWELSGWYPEYWEYVKAVRYWNGNWIDYLFGILDVYDHEYLVDDILGRLMIN